MFIVFQNIKYLFHKTNEDRRKMKYLKESNRVEPFG